jgi:uncharacterized protein YoaH (UPF0181 family)
MAQVISISTSNKLMDAVDKVCDLVDSGMSPTEATVKIAKDLSLTKHQTDLLGRGYNAGAINTQRMEGKSFEEKFASVPIVDLSKVQEALFSNTPKTSFVCGVHSMYSQPYNSSSKLHIRY